MSLPSNAAVEPYTIRIEDEILSDLERRLRDVRWADDPNNEDWYYGPPTRYMQDLVAYWRDDFDWRAAEQRLMAYDHYLADVDGVPIHFMYKEGSGASPVPLLLAHGWPWTFWFFNRIIDPLADPAADGGDPADAFDVIAPSLPGYAFSTPQTAPDMNFWKIAALFDQMMTDDLGYDRYAAAGYDFGAMICGQLGHNHSDNLYGIHLGHDIPLTLFQGERPWDMTQGTMVPEGVSDELRDEILKMARTYASHVAVHQLDAQTLTHGLEDSPVGLLSWLLRRWRGWSDQSLDFDAIFPRDELLTHATIWWATRSAGSSIRQYSNTSRYPWQPSHDRTPPIEAPTGFMLPVGDAYPPGANTAESRIRAFEEGPTAAWYNAVRVEATEDCGHFGPYEAPRPFIDGIRGHFRDLR